MLHNQRGNFSFLEQRQNVDDNKERFSCRKSIQSFWISLKSVLKRRPYDPDKGLTKILQTRARVVFCGYTLLRL